MENIKYIDNAGAYTKFIVCRTQSSTIKNLPGVMTAGDFFVFKKNGDDLVSIKKVCGGEEFACVKITIENAKEIGRVCEVLAGVEYPAHDYIDLEDGYVLMISKDEL